MVHYESKSFDLVVILFRVCLTYAILHMLRKLKITTFH